MASPCADSVLREEARQLVLSEGWNTTSYQILNPGISYWFSARRDAVIGYVRRGKTNVVAGAPVCHVERLPEVLEEWHAYLSGANRTVCYFGAEERLQSALGEEPGFAKVVLGAQPVWTPDCFVSAAKDDSSLRYQLNRARNKGVRVEEWPSARAVGNADLKRLLSEWLQTRGLPPMHFMVEPHTLDCLEDRRLFVAVLAGAPVAFVVLTPVPDRRGWLTEQFVRGFEAPNGTIELLLTEAVEAACFPGSQFVTMGIVPLSSHGASSGETHNPPWLRLAMKWFRAHGRRFYNFDGLDAFKSKFHPSYWEPIYAISKETNFSYSTLYAIAGAFSQVPPALAFGQGIGRAVVQEWNWAVGKVRLK